MLKIVWLGLLLMPLMSHGADAAKVYRWIGEDGATHFSSTPPPGVRATEMELQEPNMVIHQDNRSQLLEQGNRVGERVDALQAQRQALMQRIEEANVELDEARQAVVDGEKPLPEEVQPIIKRGVRLTEAYYQRRAAEAQRVELLEQQINALQEQLSALR